MAERGVQQRSETTNGVPCRRACEQNHLPAWGWDHRDQSIWVADRGIPNLRGKEHWGDQCRLPEGATENWDCDNRAEWIPLEIIAHRGKERGEVRGR